MPIDYKKYPEDWNERRKRILKRAKNTCEYAGCPFKHLQIVYSVKLFGTGKREWFSSWVEAEKAARDSGWQIEDLSDPVIKKVKVILTIAHLDHDEFNWDVADDRLQALCQLHHLRYDAKEKYKRIMNKNRNEHGKKDAKGT